MLDLQYGITFFVMYFVQKSV